MFKINFCDDDDDDDNIEDKKFKINRTRTLSKL